MLPSLGTDRSFSFPALLLVNRCHSILSLLKRKNESRRHPTAITNSIHCKFVCLFYYFSKRYWLNSCYFGGNIFVNNVVGKFKKKSRLPSRSSGISTIVIENNSRCSSRQIQELDRTLLSSTRRKYLTLTYSSSSVGRESPGWRVHDMFGVLTLIFNLLRIFR